MRRMSLRSFSSLRVTKVISGFAVSSAMKPAYETPQRSTVLLVGEADLGRSDRRRDA
jgi:hypothetical protein